MKPSSVGPCWLWRFDRDGRPRKKLIEVAIPLEAINAASAREKSIRHGHPSTLHLWWARRPLAACRAVLFAQLVDDPSSHPDKFPTVEAVDEERKRLFKIIEDLVVWENSTNEAVLERARAEIRKSCGDTLPPVYDPFSGGGSIPLEAQRLGLPAYGSDLNPVAVMIGKAMIEIPPKFKDREPVHPGTRDRNHYRNAEGLAEDVKRYGEWIREQGVRTHRPSISASGPAEGARRRQGDRDRLDMVAHGTEPEPGVRGRAGPHRVEFPAEFQGRQGSMDRAHRGQSREDDLAIASDKGGTKEEIAKAKAGTKAGGRYFVACCPIRRSPYGLCESQGQGGRDGADIDRHRRRRKAGTYLCRADGRSCTSRAFDQAQMETRNISAD